MENPFIRTQMLLGEEAMEKLAKSKVAIFGIGGVGSYAAEAMARAGIGNFMLIDNDCISISNINRQIHATFDTIGEMKVESMKKRMLSINPNAKIESFSTFFLPETEDRLDETCNYIIDAMDTVTAKIELVLRAKQKNIPIISSMGTGNKIEPSRLEVADIYDTSICPLAKVMRKELRAREIQNLKVVYSKEKPIPCFITEEELKSYGEKTKKRITPGSISFVPSTAGLLLASEVIKSLTGVTNNG